MSHLGWFGHKNLGDDEMLRIIQNELHDVKTFGGGTLITGANEFWNQIEPDSVAISIGVADSWKGENAEKLKLFKKIYVRDLYSYWRLMPYNVWPVLSVDLWCYLEAPKGKRRTRRFCNVEDLSHKSDYLNKVSTNIRDHCMREDYEFVSTSADHIKQFAPLTRVPDSGMELIEMFAEAEVVYATRLHVLVAAWIAGVPDIRPIIYDQKCQHFLDRVSTLTPDIARAKIITDLEEIKQML